MNNHTPKGATPLDDYSGLKISWVQNHGQLDTQLDALESENIDRALKKYLTKKI